ncbi:neprilysin-1-like [Ornithodoros turicata]|uniref:neprilysin-1-like n=1 Tax=Ornithodoros turicata TaxID=34597 RepID=UPI00313996EE
MTDDGTGGFSVHGFHGSPHRTPSPCPHVHEVCSPPHEPLLHIPYGSMTYTPSVYVPEACVRSSSPPPLSPLSLSLPRVSPPPRKRKSRKRRKHSSTCPSRPRRASRSHKGYPHVEQLVFPPTPDIVGSPVHPAKTPTLASTFGPSDSASLGTVLIPDETSSPAKRRHQRRRKSAPLTRDTYEDEWDLCALNPCIPVTLIIACVLLLLLGTASKLLQSVAGDVRDNKAIHSLTRTFKPVVQSSPKVLEIETGTKQPSCATDACLWQGQYLLGKLNNSIDPCVDFYSHVCSSNWFGEEQRIEAHPYPYSASATMMVDLWNEFRIQPTETSSFLSLAAFLVRGCVEGSDGKDTEWGTFRKILSDIMIPEWPYDAEALHVAPYDVAKKADKFLGTASLVSVFLREKPSSHQAVLHMDSPPILMRLFETALFPDGMYLDVVVRALAIRRPRSAWTQNLALDIVRLEQKMSEAAAHSARSVPTVHVSKPITEFVRLRNWDWWTYLYHFARPITSDFYTSKVVLVDPAYVDRLTTILNQTSSRTLINYIGYRVLVYLSPLLSPNKVGFLVPLSYPYRFEGYVIPERHQACMFLLERVYPFGVRSLAWSYLLRKLRPFNASQTDMVHDITGIEDLVRFEMKQSAATAPWMTQEESDIAVSKMEHMKIEIIPRSNERSLPSFVPVSMELNRLLSTYYNLIRFVRTQYLDARNLTVFHEPSTASETVFSPGFSYDPEANSIVLSPAVFAYAGRIAHNVDATALPFLVAPMVRGMFSAMDIRGCTIDAEGTLRNWWRPGTADKFLERARCLQSSFIAKARTYIQDGLDSSLFLEENIADGAVLRPLYNIFMKYPRRTGATVPGQPWKMTSRKLFFVNYATMFCEPQRDASHMKRRLRFKTSVPGKLRVNVPLSHFAPFADAFDCPVGTRMNPKQSCAFW